MARMACEGECDACLVGAVAQLGERLVRNEEVSGSIPLSSTKESTTCHPDTSVFGIFVPWFVP